jgi:hypothetical protein
MKSNLTCSLLVILIVEKIIQHIFVTLAFYFNWKDIASMVVVSPVALMVLGALVDALFILSLWGMVRKRAWAIKLVLALASFDIIGEFVAQGRLDIVITVSFIVAVCLLFLALQHQRQARIPQLFHEQQFDS